MTNETQAAPLPMPRPRTDAHVTVFGEEPAKADS